MNVPQLLAHDWYPRPLPENVRIGPRSWLYSAFAFVHYRSERPTGVSIGHDSGIYNGTFFDLGPQGEVSIGNYATLVGAILSTNGRITIGDYVFIAHEVVMASHFVAVPPLPMSDEVHPASADIIIEEGAWIGARAVLLSGARICQGAIVGAASVVDGEVPAFSR